MTRSSQTRSGLSETTVLIDGTNKELAEIEAVDLGVINIDGAEKVGIEGYLFDGDAKKLEKYLLK